MKILSSKNRILYGCSGQEEEGVPVGKYVHDETIIRSGGPKVLEVLKKRLFPGLARKTDLWSGLAFFVETHCEKKQHPMETKEDENRPTVCYDKIWGIKDQF